VTVLYDTLRLFNGYRVRRDGPESGPNVIGPISLGVKQMGARGAGNPHAACDVEGAGNVARSRGLPARQSSTLLMSGDGKRSVGPRP